jgi:DNA-binding response OmpR family regulator
VFRPDTASTTAPPAFAVPAQVLLVDVEPALAALVGEWLADAGAARVRAATLDDAAGPAGLALIELPFPREGGAERVRRLAAALPGVPLIALSPAFQSGGGARGALARSLGVHGVVAAPVTREALLAAVSAALGRLV